MKMACLPVSCPGKSICKNVLTILWLLRQITLSFKVISTICFIQSIKFWWKPTALSTLCSSCGKFSREALFCLVWVVLLGFSGGGSIFVSLITGCSSDLVTEKLPGHFHWDFPHRVSLTAGERDSTLLDYRLFCLLASLFWRELWERANRKWCLPC